MTVVREEPQNKANTHDMKYSSPQIMLAGKSMHLIESIGKVRWWTCTHGALFNEEGVSLATLRFYLAAMAQL